MQAAGEFAQLQERLLPALGLAGQPVKRGTMAHEHIVYMMLVDSAGLVRDEATIREYAPRLQALAERDDHRPYLAISQRAWGIAHCLAGEYDQAEGCFKDALNQFVEMDAVWQIGRTHFELAELALERSDPGGAVDHFTQAQDAFESLGASQDLARTRAAIKQLA